MAQEINTGASWFETALTRLLTMRVSDAARLARMIQAR
jgi:hypothetical protein